LGLGQVPGDLGAPSGIGGAVGHPADEDIRVQVDEEEDMEGFQANRLDGEEVTGDDRRGLGSHELTPGLAPCRGRRFSARIRPMLVVEISAPTFLSSPLRRQ
jgi:hypothetical protein